METVHFWWNVSNALLVNTIAAALKSSIFLSIYFPSCEGKMFFICYIWDLFIISWQGELSTTKWHHLFYPYKHFISLKYLMIKIGHSECFIDHMTQTDFCEQFIFILLTIWQCNNLTRLPFKYLSTESLCWCLK